MFDIAEKAGILFCYRTFHRPTKFSSGGAPVSCDTKKKNMLRRLLQRLVRRFLNLYFPTMLLLPAAELAANLGEATPLTMVWEQTIGYQRS